MSGRMVIVVVLLLVVGGVGAVVVTRGEDQGGSGVAGCAGRPEGPTVEVVYEVRAPGAERLPRGLRQRVAETLCERLRDTPGLGDAQVRLHGGRELAVVAAVAATDRPADDPVGAIDIAAKPATLAFYDWEANVIGDPDRPITGRTALYEAALRAAKERPRVEREDLPAGGPDPRELRDNLVDPADERAVTELYDELNNVSAVRYILFGPDRLPRTSRATPASRGGPGDDLGGPPVTSLGAATCADLLASFEQERSAPRTHHPRTACRGELERLGNAGPESGSRVVEIPRGIAILDAERAPDEAPSAYHVLEDDAALSSFSTKSPFASPVVVTEPRTGAPVVRFEFTESGRLAFARLTKRLADRGRDAKLRSGSDPSAAFQRFAVALDGRLVSLATIDFRVNPEGIDGGAGVQLEDLGTALETGAVVAALRHGPLTAELVPVSVSR